MKNRFVKALDHLRANFIYTKDKREKWTILEGDDVPLRGDCEDFSLTLMWRAGDKSMFQFWKNVVTFKTLLWYCWSPSGEGHAILWVRGQGWVDNIHKEFTGWGHRKRMGYRLFFPYVAPLLALKMLVAR